MPGARVKAPTRKARRPSTRAYEALTVAPLVIWLLLEVPAAPSDFAVPSLLLWAASIAIVDLLPVPTGVELRFSLSFPLQLAVALLYPPPVAAAVAFLGTSDRRELDRELPLGKSLFIRAEIAWSVVAESLMFHAVGSIDSAWYVLGIGVLLATIVGYSVNALLVAVYFGMESGQPVGRILREMHVGVFGEFLLSYMGLAIFSVLVATTFVEIGIWSIAVFIAPLAFARQMFRRTHSLQVASRELAARQAENEYQALHDGLTGLPNRMLFQQRLTEAIADARARGSLLAVMLMDLDHFKEINDALGHHFGDELLKEIGPRLATVLREGDLMARLGGDEFGVVLPDLPTEDVAIRISRRLLEELEHPLTVEGLALDVSGSIGIALFPAHSHDAETLIRRADVAMYAAKEAGGGFEVYHPDLDRSSSSRLTLIAQVRPGLERGEFELFYQPKARLDDGGVIGVEALIRWRHPEHGIVMPGDFISMVERTVLLRPLTRFVIDEVLRQCEEWDRLGIRVQAAANLSPRSLLDLELPQDVARALDYHDVPPGRLLLELTESFLMADSGRSVGVLTRLSELGVSLSIDDFGTGYSSLSHLKRLPIDEIKIDRSFVAQMDSDPNDAAIVRATVELGANLGLRVVAEGVEDRVTWDRLAEMGCELAQGFHLARPMPARETTVWLRERLGVSDPAPGVDRLRAG